KPDDVVHRQFRELLQDVLSPNKTTFVAIDSWTRVVENREIDKKKQENNKVFFLTMLTPELFRNAIILGANLEESMLFDWLRRYHRVTFAQEKAIYANLQPIPEHNSQRLDTSHFRLEK